MDKNCVVWRDRRVQERDFLLPSTLREQVNEKKPMEDSEEDWPRKENSDSIKTEIEFQAGGSENS